MADSNITKRALSAAFKELLQTEAFEKISVADICDKCHMNRKSFYYHFKDKYDLPLHRIHRRNACHLRSDRHTQLRQPSRKPAHCSYCRRF